MVREKSVERGRKREKVLVLGGRRSFILGRRKSVLHCNELEACRLWLPSIAILQFSFQFSRTRADCISSQA
jgi:hypothetical protein